MDTTDTCFKPKRTIPGLNMGGWHDAGDDDVNTGSNDRTVYQLALAIDEFGMYSDQITVYLLWNPFCMNDIKNF
jgi:hypothetical protein